MVCRGRVYAVPVGPATHHNDTVIVRALTKDIKILGFTAGKSVSPLAIMLELGDLFPLLTMLELHGRSVSLLARYWRKRLFKVQQKRQGEKQGVCRIPLHVLATSLPCQCVQPCG